MKPLCEIRPYKDPKKEGLGELVLNFHKGQVAAWNANKRFVLVLAGTQSGKTEFGPLWLLREIKTRGPGDYGVVSPSFKLMGLKALPAFLHLFREVLKLGTYVSSPSPIFKFSSEGLKKLFGEAASPLQGVTVYFGHAENPDSLESATYKAVWADEAGQSRFRLQSWEALQRRLSTTLGRALLTTTPYNFGWLHSELYEPWNKDHNHPDIDVIRFESRDNPMFPLEEWERAKRTLPSWRFDLYYRAIFTRPPGLIYSDFTDGDVVEPFPIPEHWNRYLGLDFGSVNTAAVFYAEHPDTKELFAYRDYHGGGKTAAQHAAQLKRGEPENFPTMSCGGCKSEGNWRDEFGAAGIHILPPDIAEVEVGIDRCTAFYKTHRIKVFNTCQHYLDELRQYSRVVDERGNSTEEIENKSSWHMMDASRYILGRLGMKRQPFVIVAQPPKPEERKSQGPKLKRDTSWDGLGVLRLPKPTIKV